MKKVTPALLNKMARQIAHKSAPNTVRVDYGLNTGFPSWSVIVFSVDYGKYTAINSFEDSSSKKLKIAAQRGVVPGEEVKV